MEIFKVKIPGEKAKYFLHPESRDMYLDVLQDCKNKGGAVKFDIETIEVDERDPIEVTPLFDAYGVTKVWDVEVVIHKANVVSTKVLESVDIILEFADPKDYTIAVPWLAQCTKGIAKSWVSEDHALSLAKTAALELYKEKFVDVEKSIEVHQDDQD